MNNLKCYWHSLPLFIEGFSFFGGSGLRLENCNHRCNKLIVMKTMSSALNFDVLWVYHYLGECAVLTEASVRQYHEIHKVEVTSI